MLINKKPFVDFVVMSDNTYMIKLESIKKYAVPDDRFEMLAITLTVEYGDSLELITQTISALDELCEPLSIDVKLILIFNYLPYARQDRVCAVGQANGKYAYLKTLLGFVESLAWLDNYECHIVDEHSSHERYGYFTWDISQKDIFGVFFDNFYNTLSGDDIVFIAPDKGALPKIEALKNAYDGSEVITFDKVRDGDTGKIISITTDEELCPSERTAFIVDDICDGGGTFIPIIEQLDGDFKYIVLFVTHGIFSKGTDDIRAAAKESNLLIVTTNSVKVTPDVDITLNLDGILTELDFYEKESK